VTAAPRKETAANLPTEPLRAEHRELLPHIAVLRTIGDSLGRWDADTARQIVGAVTLLHDHLVSHARAEEAVLYPTVESLQEAPGATATMVADHAEIVARIDTLEALGRSLSRRRPSEAEANELRAQLYGLWAIVALHFVKEEEILLPILDAHMSDADALTLFERMDAVAHPRTPA
jgi:iron-sulfur cluster repair protein YtfE (RIC family)